MSETAAIMFERITSGRSVTAVEAAIEGSEVRFVDLDREREREMRMK